MKNFARTLFAWVRKVVGQAIDFVQCRFSAFLAPYEPKLLFLFNVGCGGMCARWWVKPLILFAQGVCLRLRKVWC